MKPGTRVICIDDDFSSKILNQLEAAPRKGEIYTVRELVPDPMGELIIGITLEGLINPKGWMPCKGGLVVMEFSFRSDRFVQEEQPEGNEWEEHKINLEKPLPEVLN